MIGVIDDHAARLQKAGAQNGVADEGGNTHALPIFLAAAGLCGCGVWLDVEVFQVVCDGEGLVGLALLAHAVGPVGHGEVGPVVVALFKLGPGVLQDLLPGLVAEQLPERGGGDLDTVVVVRAIGLGDGQQGVAQLDQFEIEGLERLEGFLVVAGPGAAFGAQGGDVLVDLRQLGFDEVVDGGEEGLVGQAGIVEPERVAARTGRDRPVDRGLAAALAVLCRTSTTLSARDNHLGRFSGR